eukprot:scaffold243388_cov21-Tisochrysis_lutea.AAC.1
MLCCCTTQAAVDDLQRQLSAATAELTQAKASLRTTKEELEALKCRHENLVKAGVEIAQLVWAAPGVKQGDCFGISTHDILV